MKRKVSREIPSTREFLKMYIREIFLDKILNHQNRSNFESNCDIFYYNSITLYIIDKKTARNDITEEKKLYWKREYRDYLI